MQAAKLSERAPIALSDARMKELVLPTLRRSMAAFMARYQEHERDELRIYFLAAPSTLAGAGEQVCADQPLARLSVKAHRYLPRTGI